MKKFLLIFLLYGTFLQAQNTTAVSPSNEFSYNEFLGYVKKYHPLVKNADLRNHACSSQFDDGQRWI